MKMISKIRKGIGEVWNLNKLMSFGVNVDRIRKLFSNN
jgi:hypothetical protein